MRHNHFGHPVFFTTVRGDTTSTYSGNLDHMDYLSGKLVEIARDPFTKLIEVSVPHEFFDELVTTVDRETFKLIVAQITDRSACAVL